MDGVLVVDKPGGMTSHDVVARVRKVLGTRKVGHGGTLDPDATGVLVLGIGRATRLLSYAQGDSKRYAARVRFGTSTTTQDASGEVLERKLAEVTKEDVERELKAFRGTIDQVPPMVSAVKIGGERLYRKARRGESVERPARTVTIHSLEMSDFEGGAEPEVSLEIECSGGTYVRTLAHDLGANLGCGAHLASLRRTRSGAFSLDDAVPLDEVGPEALLPLLDAVRGLPKLEVDEPTADKIAVGRPLERLPSEHLGPCALVRDGELLAIYRNETDRAVPDKVIPR